jgi:DNA-binding LacI/PurR family transcriptional regulator
VAERASGPGPARRPTIRDVAERAGVSKSLVSLVMRGEPPVREDKRRRVLRAAGELGYRTNWAARSLSAVRSGAVGVLVADLRNPWSIDVVEAVGRALDAAGLTTLMTSAVLPSSAGGERRLDAGVIGALRDLRVDGLLVVGSVPDRARLAEVVVGMPVVVVGARAEGLTGTDVVRSDDAAGMALVVDHLVERGHRRIAHLGGVGGAVADERAAGYRSAMRRHGLGGEVAVQACDFSEDAGYAAAAALLGGGRRRPVTALAAVNDLAAVGALSAAADAGVAPPGGLAVTGYDDTFLAEIRQLSLTSVNPDSAGIGELAARHLVQRIAAPDRPAVERLVPPRLVVRASSSRPAHGPDEADRSTGRGPGGAGPVSGHRPEEAAR